MASAMLVARSAPTHGCPGTHQLVSKLVASVTHKARAKCTPLPAHSGRHGGRQAGKFSRIGVAVGSECKTKVFNVQNSGLGVSLQLARTEVNFWILHAASPIRRPPMRQVRTASGSAPRRFSLKGTWRDGPWTAGLHVVRHRLLAIDSSIFSTPPRQISRALHLSTRAEIHALTCPGTLRGGFQAAKSCFARLQS